MAQVKEAKRAEKFLGGEFFFYKLQKTEKIAGRPRQQMSFRIIYRKKIILYF